MFFNSCVFSLASTNHFQLCILLASMLWSYKCGKQLLVHGKMSVSACREADAASLAASQAIKVAK